MQFSLRVICNYRIIETIKQRVTELTDHLCLFDGYAFSPYWKDDECAILELHANIENPDYSKIQQYVQSASGIDKLSQCSSLDDWECAHFAPLSELHSNKDIAFVVCNIF